MGRELDSSLRHGFGGCCDTRAELQGTLSTDNGVRKSSDALVIDGNTRQALVVTRALGRAGLRVTTAEAIDACDQPLRAPACLSRWSAQSAVLPSYENRQFEYGQTLLDLVREYPTRVIVPSMDGSITALRPWRSSFERENVALAMASDEALEVANNKQRTLALAASLGIASPRTVPIDSIDDIPAALAEVGYPAVIKPVQSWARCGDAGIRVVSEVVLNESEAMSHVELLNQVGSAAIAQEWVGGAREAVSLFYAHGRIWAEFAQLARRMSPVLGGVSVVREGIAMPAELRSAAVALIESLDLQGYSEIEFRRDAMGRAMLMEINARLSGSLEVASRSGVDFPSLLWRWAADEQLSPSEGYRSGVRMRFLNGDLEWLWENFKRRDRPDSTPPWRAVGTFTKEFFRLQSYDYVDRTDIRPAWEILTRELKRARRKFCVRLDHDVRSSATPSKNGRKASPTHTDVVVIGAGPNGLSLAAHLNNSGVEHRIFGQTMGAWRFNMPAGMLLKSEPYSSDLSAPRPGFLARDYGRARNAKFPERVVPLSRENFVDYGTWFAHQLVPNVEECEITSLAVAPGGFLVRTAQGEAIRATRVVVATGIIPFAYVPPAIAGLPSDLVSHSSAHVDLGRFQGQSVLVVGRGQSALETAALLCEHGASVKLVIRGDGVQWNAPNVMEPTRWEQFKKPVVRLCEGWHCWAYDRLPDLFHFLPEATRIRRGLGFLGPAGSWWLRDRVEGRVPMLTGHRVVSADAHGDGVRVSLRNSEGMTTEEADHVIAGTGFRFDLARLDFLEPALRDQLKVTAGAPLLDHNFQSNVDGLFFTGALAAPSLGPLMRFVAGTHFTGPRIARRLHASSVGT